MTPAQVKEYQRAYQKHWRRQHPDYHREWQVMNRDYVAMKKREYRARKRMEEQV
jgi:hypothetical protein